MKKSNDDCVRLFRTECSLDSARRVLRVWKYIFTSVVVMSLLPVTRSAGAITSEDLTSQLKRASVFHEQANYACSIPILEKIVKRYPRNHAANLLLGEDLLSYGRARNALAPLQVASEMDPRDVAVQFYLAEAFAAVGDFSIASKILQSAITKSGGGSEFLVAWANFSLDRFRSVQDSLRSTRRGEGTELRVEAASYPEGNETRESLLAQSAARNPDQRGIWGELGVAQLELWQREQVQMSLDQAQKRDPQGAETLQLEALLAAVEQKWSEANELLLVLGARSPAQLRRVLLLWPRVLVPRSDVTGSIWNCLRNVAAPCLATSAQPRSEEGLSAEELYAGGRWEQLIALPVPATPDNSETLWHGVALAETADCLRAIPLLESGLKADGQAAGFWLEVCYGSEVERVAAQLSKERDWVAFHQLRGDVLLQLRFDAAGAQKEYSEALKLRPDDSRLLERLAQAYMTMGDTEQAQKLARAAVVANPHEALAVRLLAQIAISRRDYADALAHLKRLVKFNPSDAWIRVELGVAYGQLGDPAEALHYLRPELEAGYPDKKGGLHAQLATILRELGRKDEASQAAIKAERLANMTLESVAPESANAHQ